MDAYRFLGDDAIDELARQLQELKREVEDLRNFKNAIAVSSRDCIYREKLLHNDDSIEFDIPKGYQTHISIGWVGRHVGTTSGERSLVRARINGISSSSYSTSRTHTSGNTIADGTTSDSTTAFVMGDIPHSGGPSMGSFNGNIIMNRFHEDHKELGRVQLTGVGGIRAGTSTIQNNICFGFLTSPTIDNIENINVFIANPTRNAEHTLVYVTAWKQTK